MKDAVGGSERARECVRIERLALNKGELRRLSGIFEEFAVPRRKIVERDDVMTNLEESIDEVAADKAGAARDDRAHSTRRQLPVPAATTQTVCSRILMSSHSDQLS